MFAPSRFSLNGAMVSSAPIWQSTLSACGRSGKLQLREVTVFDGTSFHGTESRGPLAHVFEGFADVLVVQIHAGNFELQVLVIAQGKIRHDFKDGAELQGLTFVKIQLVNLRL